MAIESFEIYIGSALMGLFVSLGSAIGTFLSYRYIIKQFNQLEKKLKRGFKNDKKTKESRNKRRV